MDFRIRENPESWALEPGIQLKEPRIPLTIDVIRNPNSTGKESRIQFQIRASRIQDYFKLPYMGRYLTRHSRDYLLQRHVVGTNLFCVLMLSSPRYSSFYLCDGLHNQSSVNFCDMSLVRNFVVKKPFSDHTKIDKPSAINRFKRALNVCRGLHSMNTEHTCHESAGRMQFQRRMSPVSLRKQPTFRQLVSPRSDV